MSEPVILEHDWYSAPVPANVVLGERTWLYSSYAFRHYYSERPCGLCVGHDTGIYIETFFDLGPEGEVVIGDYCTLAGPIISTGGRVTIGNHVLISREVIIADGFVPVPDRSTARPRQDGASTPSESLIEIGNDAWIGTRAILLPGARVGVGAIVGAYAVIDFDVPDYAIVAGNPARVVGSAPPARSGS